jgi:hypothetical protein
VCNQMENKLFYIVTTEETNKYFACIKESKKKKIE